MPVLHSRTHHASGVALAAILCLHGCAPKPLAPGQDGPRSDPRSGLYGPIPEAPRREEAPAIARRSLESGDWNESSFALLQSELTPALLVRAQHGYLGLFGDLQRHGLGPPGHVAFSAREGPRAFKAGDTMNVLDMEECWILVWFAGARGWTEWDSPWAVFLQHKPLAMKLDEAGLHLQFRRQAGEVVLMPLYGCELLPAAAGGEPGGKRPKDAPPVTGEWSEVLKRDLLMRVRYWAGVSRRIPIHSSESFRVDRAKDALTLRQSLAWHPIVDDWNTPALKLAPVPPALALAMDSGSFPVTFSTQPFDLQMVTPAGPYLGIQDVDQYDATLKVLDVVHETEQGGLREPVTNRLDAAAVTLLRETVNSLLPESSTGLLGAAADADMVASFRRAHWIAKALPWVDPPTSERAAASLQAFFHNDRVRQFIDGVDAGSGTGPGGIAMHVLEPVWAYAHHTGDWDWIRAHWPRLRAWQPGAAAGAWSTCGDGATVELGLGAAPQLALARMAYRMGDLDAYEVACYLLAGHLIRQHARLSGAAYVRDHRPWLHPEAAEVHITRLQPGPDGWHVEEPRPTGGAVFGLHERRWLHFVSEDVARFHRRHARPWVREDLDRMLARPAGDDARAGEEPTPMTLLRSLLLNEVPEQLAAHGIPAPAGADPIGRIAHCLAQLRTSQPVLVERLIPAAAPGPWRLGAERDIQRAHPALVVRVHPEGERGGPPAGAPDWPRPGFGDAWPAPGGSPLTVGRMAPVREGAPGSLRATTLNWNTRVWIHE